MQYNPVVDRRYAPSSRRDDPEWFMLPSTLALAAFRAIEEDHDAEVHDRHQRLVIHRVPTMARRAALRFRLLHAPRPRRGHGRLGRDAGSRTPATLGARVSARRPDVDRVHADRKVLRREGDGSLVEHADLSGLASWHLNDMLVNHDGQALLEDLLGQAIRQPARPARDSACP